MRDRGIKSKRRWAEWLSFLSAVAGPAAVVMFPQYAVPIASGVAAVTGAAGYLAKRSKDVEEETCGNVNQIL
jgi:hypothetical protein